MSTDEAMNETAYQFFRRYERPYRFGRFTGCMRGDLTHTSVYVRATERAALVWQMVNKDRDLNDFTGYPRLSIQKGDVMALRLGGLDKAFNEFIGKAELMCWLADMEARGNASWVWIWQEDRALAELLRSMQYRCVLLRVTASSEYRALYYKANSSTSATFQGTPLPLSERPALARLNLPLRRLNVEPLRLAIERVMPAFAEHYSDYNKRHSWSACALRGFGGLADRIEKPAEMSKAWKLQHADKMNLLCQDTELRWLLPEVEPLLAALGEGEFQRIRLMKLSMGEGELSRHADITDKEAGTMDGRIMRLHIPIVTNPGVRFTAWSYDGVEQETSFEAGEAFYLDTRKAHKAVNTGEADRIHLVIDAYANDYRRAMISQTGCL